MSAARLAVRDSRLVLGCALAVFALFAAGQAIRYAASPEILYPDFFGLWSFARFLRDHAAAAIYDSAALLAFQQRLDPGFTDHYPFLYPPPFLLLLWPFGEMPYAAARGAWIAVSLGAFLFAVAGLRWRRPLAVAAALAPATTVCVFYGQNGLISAALVIGGMRLARAHQILAGVLFGALVYKPQLGLLIPVALAAAGLWSAIAAAALTATAIVAVSVAVSGWAMWPAWFAAMRAVSGLPDNDRAHLDLLMPTVSAAVRHLGGAPGLAVGVQALVALAAAAIVWRCWRRGGSVASDATLPVAAILATPYAFGYDLPMVAAAALLALDERGRRTGSFASIDLLAALFALLLPIVYLSTLTIGAPLGVAALALLLWRLASTGD